MQLLSLGLLDECFAAPATPPPLPTHDDILALHRHQEWNNSKHSCDNEFAVVIFDSSQFPGRYLPYIALRTLCIAVCPW